MTNGNLNTPADDTILAPRLTACCPCGEQTGKVFRALMSRLPSIITPSYVNDAIMICRHVQYGKFV
jgi:hypothetical protein